MPPSRNTRTSPAVAGSRSAADRQREHVFHGLHRVHDHDAVFGGRGEEQLVAGADLLAAPARTEFPLTADYIPLSSLAPGDRRWRRPASHAGQMNPQCQSYARVTIVDSEGATARGCPRHAVALTPSFSRRRGPRPPETAWKGGTVKGGACAIACDSEAALDLAKRFAVLPVAQAPEVPTGLPWRAT